MFLKLDVFWKHGTESFCCNADDILFVKKWYKAQKMINFRAEPPQNMIPSALQQIRGLALLVKLKFAQLRYGIVSLSGENMTAGITLSPVCVWNVNPRIAPKTLGSSLENARSTWMRTIGESGDRVKGVAFGNKSVRIKSTSVRYV